MTAKIAYIVSRFPHLPETFILREMSALEKLERQIVLFPLIRQYQTVVHTEAENWIERAHFKPHVSLAILKTNLTTFFKNPRRFFTVFAQIIIKNFRSFQFLIRAILLFPKAVAMSQDMKAEGVTHIHAHYATHPALVAWIIHQFSGTPYSLTVHAHDIFVCRVMLDTKLREAEFIVSISEFNRNFLEDNVGAWISKKIHIVHCGVELHRYPSQRPRYSQKKCFEIINVGSLQPYKGQQYLLQACLLLKDRGMMFRCRIIGEGNERASLEHYIAKHRLAGEVQLLGAQSQAQVAILMASAHCYVQPSVITPTGKMEGIPVALMEALASGLPVVATDLSGIPELVRPKETGYLVPARNARALCDALMEVRDNWEGAKRLADKGRELVVKEFQLQKNVMQLSALFTTIRVGKRD